MSYSCKKELLVLVGPMGAGKSTIGKLLAQELAYKFYDSDKVIEERCGADIPWIFDVEGEEGFRNREAVVIKDLSMKKSAVVATGGGAMLRQDNRDYVTRTGYVIYLNTSVEQQFQRTCKDKNRPLLQGKGDEAYEVLTRLMQIRDPLYRQVADLVVETDRKNLKAVVAKILKEVCENA
ncbi:MAG: shikimate kinase AroK [Oleiphilus sp.]|nr:MAG: shikimate kinase AroK [Oleiphilus sp.]